jgi:3',5'-nucleoside bisphosphate phosphatase
MKIDLHIHTTASDGSWDPVQCIAEVQKAGIELFAITDHETVENVTATQQLATAAGLRFLAGVEISTTIRGQSFHILGYGVDPSTEQLRRILHRNTELLEEVDDESVRKLIADGFAIDYEEYCAYQHNPARGGWKSLSFLIDKGFCKDVTDFFTNLFTAERGFFFPEFAAPSEVIGAIKASGGVPVLAHPGSDFHGPSLEETLDLFGNEAIEGIECFHPGHDMATTRHALQWCNRNGLLITGGSDCHGSFVPQRRLGVPEIRFEQIRLGKLEEDLDLSRL